MKNKLILSILLILSTQISSQELSIAPGYSIGSYDHFRSAINYRIGYHILIKEKGRVGFSFSQAYNNQPFAYTFMSDADGKDYHRTMVPKNHWLEFSINYTWNVLHSTNSHLFIGPELALNFYKINETGTQTINNEPESFELNQEYWEKSKPGFGLIFDYDIQTKLEYLKIFASVKPELIFLSRFGLKGYSGQVVVWNMDTKLGVKLDLNKIFSKYKL